MSTKAIWRFDLKPSQFVEGVDYEIPAGFRVVHVGCKESMHVPTGNKVWVPSFWVEVDPSPIVEKTVARFMVVPTGHEWDTWIWSHEGTFIMGEYVWHLLRKNPEMAQR